MLIRDREVFLFIYGIVLFLIFFFIYLTFYYVVDRSVSSRLMIEIDNAPGKKLTFDQIKSVYDEDTKYANEIQGMLDGGFIREKEGYYSCTPKGLIFAGCASWYKKAFRLGKGG